MHRRYFRTPAAPYFTHYPAFSSQAVPTNKDGKATVIEMGFAAAFATLPRFDMAVKHSGQPDRNLSIDDSDDAAVPFALF